MTRGKGRRSQAEKTQQTAGRPSTCSDICRRRCARCGCVRDARGGCGQVGIPNPGSALLRYGTPEKLSGALASAWLTARPGRAELTAVEFRTNAQFRLGEDLFPGQDRDMACVCGRAAAAGVPTPWYAVRCGVQLWLVTTSWRMHGAGYSPEQVSPPTCSQM